MPNTPDTLEGSALRRATQRLIPFLLLLYVIAFIDRVNLGFAKQPFLRDTGLSDAAYAFGAGIFFIGYALFEIPSNLILHRVGARLWMCRIMVSWGLISAAMLYATTAPVFYTLRFLLGAAEAGFFPGVILYLTYWFPTSRRGPTMGLFYFGAPIAQILGGPLSGWLLEFHGLGGLHGWQWMFLVEGLLACLVGVVILFYLPNRPADARWLTPEQRRALETAVARETPPGAGEHGRVWTVLSQPRLLYFGLLYALIQMSVYGVTFYLPSQVARLLGRQAGLLVGCVSAIPWICALLAAFLVPRIAARTGRRASWGAFALACAAGGIALSASGSPKIALGALCVATAGFIGAQPVFWTFPTSEFSGKEAAAAIALINSLGAMGGFFAPNVRVLIESHWTLPGAASYGLAGFTLLAALIFTTLRTAQVSPVAPRERPG